MARLFTIASDETLLSMISSARERLVIVAPGLSKVVALALADRIKCDDCPTELSVTLDVDPEVCRLGYGDLEALEILAPALVLRARSLQTQRGVRVGLVVADSDVLVYSPTPELIEAGSNSEEKPNAIRITDISPQGIAFACGANDSQVLGMGQEVGLHIVSDEAIEDAKADLKDNPPKRFDLARLERVFNYKLEFVEFSVEGFSLKAKIVELPPSLLGFVEKDLKERLKNRFRVFESGAPFKFTIPDPFDLKVEIDVTEEWITKEADRLRKDFFIPLGSSSYGNLILKRRKMDFLKAVSRLESIVGSYAVFVKKNIAAKVQETRDSLINTLLLRVQEATPTEWLAQSVDGKLEPEELLEKLQEKVDKAFGKVEETFSPVVTCIFKGVQYETITADPRFRERIEKYFGKKEAARLLSEYEASRAEDPTK